MVQSQCSDRPVARLRFPWLQGSSWHNTLGFPLASLLAPPFASLSSLFSSLLCFPCLYDHTNTTQFLLTNHRRFSHGNDFFSIARTGRWESQPRKIARLLFRVGFSCSWRVFAPWDLFRRALLEFWLGPTIDFSGGVSGRWGLLS